MLQHYHQCLTKKTCDVFVVNTSIFFFEKTSTHWPWSNLCVTCWTPNHLDSEAEPKIGYARVAWDLKMEFWGWDDVTLLISPAILEDLEVDGFWITGVEMWLKVTWSMMNIQLTSKKGSIKSIWKVEKQNYVPIYNSYTILLQLLLKRSNVEEPNCTETQVPTGHLQQHPKAKWHKHVHPFY